MLPLVAFFGISLKFLKFQLIFQRGLELPKISEEHLMKRVIVVLLSLALVLGFAQTLLSGDEPPCKFQQLKPDRRGWARFRCPDCTVVSVKQGPWSQRHVARSVCAQVGPGTSAQAIVPNNRKKN